jgi:hypothetical protein
LMTEVSAFLGAQPRAGPPRDVSTSRGVVSTTFQSCQSLARERPGWDAIPAVRSGQIVEIKSPLILQPGPAALTDGLNAMKAAIAAA